MTTPREEIANLCRAALAEGRTAPSIREERAIADRLADSILATERGGGVPEGFVLVPGKPTPEMVGAWWRQKNTGTQEPGSFGRATSDYEAYEAMLAASPKPPEEGRSSVLPEIRSYLRERAFGCRFRAEQENPNGGRTALLAEADDCDRWLAALQTGERG